MREGRASVLVVDDDPDVLRISIAMLQAEGIDAHGADDLASALRVLETSGATVDAVVLDFGASGPSPSDSISRLRASAPSASVIVVSGDDVPPSSVPGACEVMRKPYRPRLLADTVRALVRRPEPARDGRPRVDVPRPARGPG